jgi:DNA-binding NarL/FixJ family response regulator
MRRAAAEVCATVGIREWVRDATKPTGRLKVEDPGCHTATAEPSGATAPTAASTPTRLLLVEQHLIMRVALRVLLETDRDFEVVRDVGSIKEGRQAARKYKPDVAIVDIRLPDGSGIEFAQELLQRNASTRVLILTAHAQEAYVRAALAAGVTGYVLKSARYAELAKAIRMVHEGQMFLSVCEPPEARLPPLRGSVKLFSVTTLREREILTAIALGSHNKDIARDLRLSVKTIEKHRSNLMRKLDMHCVAALTMFAFEQGLVGAPSPKVAAAKQDAPPDGLAAAVASTDAAARDLRAW